MGRQPGSAPTSVQDPDEVERTIVALRAKQERLREKITWYRRPP